MLYARFGNGIATNNLSKVIAGLMLPGRPIGNMYFAAWSHNVINGAVQLSMDLKLGEYRKSSYMHTDCSALSQLQSKSLRVSCS